MSDPRLARATPDQLERLAAITDERQRETLLDCIARGESIPAFAWKPLPLSRLMPHVQSDRESQSELFRLRQSAMKRDSTLPRDLESLDAPEDRRSSD